MLNLPNQIKPLVPIIAPPEVISVDKMIEDKAGNTADEMGRELGYPVDIKVTSEVLGHSTIWDCSLS